MINMRRAAALQSRGCCLPRWSLPPHPLWTWSSRVAAAAATQTSSTPPRHNIIDNVEVNQHIKVSRPSTKAIEISSTCNLAVVTGAVASAAILYQSSQHGSQQKWGSGRNNILNRNYHNTVNCESKDDSNNNKSTNNNQSSKKKGELSPDSFFDLAQQWANEVLSSKNDNLPSESAAAAAAASTTTSSSNTDNPEEAFLHKLGLMDKKSLSNSTDLHEKNNSNALDIIDDQNNTSVKQMVQSVFNKIQDEIQSSIPKPASPQSTTGQANSSNEQQDNADMKSSDFLSFADNISSFFSRKSSNPDIAEIIQQAQNIANDHTSSAIPSSSSLSSTGFLSQVLYFQQNAKTIQRILESSFGPYMPDDIQISDLFKTMPIAAMHYYLEHQDSIKTPSWKRRRHRFQPSVEVMKVNELNEALILSELSYADSVEDVRVGLGQLYNTSDRSKSSKDKMDKPQWELLFCDTQSKPNQPSHFLAIQKNASQYDDTLHVLMVVRGTKSMSDLITDAMMEATDYEYNGVQGKAHIGMVRSGDYLVARHKKLLSTLLNLSNKRKLDITLVGHSLGAGAATIAAMNMNSEQFSKDIGNDGEASVKVSANVIGFGCPAILSQNLSLLTKNFVTTVIADADVIPRMSGATLVNLLLDLRQFEYQEQAERDVEQALRELQGRLTDSSPTTVGSRQSNKGVLSIDEDAIQKVMGYVHRGIEKVSGDGDVSESSSTKDAAIEKMVPCLFPPGCCIHFYRDGSGIDGTYVPCTFFDEIDVARTMVDDHLISSGYRKIFLNMMRDFHKDDHFSFDSRNRR